MSLPRLTWRLIKPRDLAVTGTIAGAIAGMKSQIINSGVFWEIVESAATGSETIIIKPTTVNLTGSSDNMNVVITGNVTGTSAYQQDHTNTDAEDYLCVGFTPDIRGHGGAGGISGSFITASSDTPFGNVGGVSNVRWSKYWKFCDILTNDLSGTFFLESEESIFIGIRNAGNPNTFGTHVGACLESFDSGSGEHVTGTTGRVYGMTASANVRDALIWGINGWFSSTVTDNSFVSGIFVVSGGVTHDKFDVVRKNDVYAMTAGEGTTSEGTIVGLPFHVSTYYAPSRFVGRSRGVYTMDDRIGGVHEFIDGAAQVVAYAVGVQAAAADALLFGPASGSV